MPSPLLPGDHQVLRKLCDELLPWMICGRRVGNQWFVWLSRFYAYTGDGAAALAGLGIGSPLVALINGSNDPNQNALETLNKVLPKSLFYAGIAALFVWVVLRLVVQREDVVARALQAREFARSITGAFVQLERALADPNPVPQINTIQKTIDDRVQDAIKNGVWPWDPPRPPSAEIELELKEAIDRFRLAFMPSWTPPPPGVT